jgi:hypothetical protein
MKLTIIPEDGAVYKDGFFYGGLDLSFVSSNIHALQWKDTAGWIEFKNIDGNKPSNEIITEIPTWANDCLNKWQEAENAKIAKDIADAILLEEYERSRTQPATEGTQQI